MRQVFLLIFIAAGGLAAACDDDGGNSDTSSSTDGDTSSATGSEMTVDTGEDSPTLPTNTDPGDATVSFAIDSTAQRRAISPFIYGTNQPNWSGGAAHLTLGRLGGNRWTAYNWENNASNAGSDWNYSSDAYLGGGQSPAEAVRLRVQEAHDAGASTLVTVPIVDYLAADKDGSVQPNDPARFTTRFVRNEPAKGASFETSPNLGDGVVYQDEFIHWLSQVFPGAIGAADQGILLCLDNEPDLWSSTHPEVHPEAVTYAELVERSVDYAAAIKAVAPAAKVFGFVSYGWNGFVTLQDAPDAGANGDFIDYYLAQLAQAEKESGQRLVDVLDLHWYPEAQGNGQRIINEDTSPGMVEARVQAPRSLWDDAYTEDSWIAQWQTMGPIRLLPRLREKIDAQYPGTLLAITEYNYGGGTHISGALAQADVLGIFGRESVYAATLWEMNDDQSFIYGAFAMYRSYDGQGGAFGDVSIEATTTDLESTSVYASVAAGHPERMVLVALNKTASELKAHVAITHTRAYSSVEVYQLKGAGASPQRAADVGVATNAFDYVLPAYSVSTLVLRP